MYKIFLSLLLFFLFVVHQVEAKDCGGAVVCEIGDRIVSDYTFPANQTIYFNYLDYYTVLNNVRINLNGSHLKSQRQIPNQPDSPRGFIHSPFKTNNIATPPTGVIIENGIIDGFQSPLSYGSSEEASYGNLLNLIIINRPSNYYDGSEINCTFINSDMTLPGEMMPNGPFTGYKHIYPSHSYTGWNHEGSAFETEDWLIQGSIGTSVEVPFKLLSPVDDSGPPPTTLTITTVPSETVEINLSNAPNYTATFTPSKNGLYSLIIIATWSDGSATIKTKIPVIIGNMVDAVSQKMYIHGFHNDEHVYPFDKNGPYTSGLVPFGTKWDNDVLNYNKPVIDSATSCSDWVINEFDGNLTVPFMAINSVDYKIKYHGTSTTQFTFLRKIYSHLFVLFEDKEHVALPSTELGAFAEAEGSLQLLTLFPVDTFANKTQMGTHFRSGTGNYSTGSGDPYLVSIASEDNSWIRLNYKIPAYPQPLNWDDDNLVMLAAYRGNESIEEYTVVIENPLPYAVNTNLVMAALPGWSQHKYKINSGTLTDIATINNTITLPLTIPGTADPVNSPSIQTITVNRAGGKRYWAEGGSGDGLLPSTPFDTSNLLSNLSNRLNGDINYLMPAVFTGSCPEVSQVANGAVFARCGLLASGLTIANTNDCQAPSANTVACYIDKSFLNQWPTIEAGAVHWYPSGF